MASHKQIALSEGPAAGLRAYIGTLSKFGEGTPQANKLDELLAMPREERFQFYCEQTLNSKGAAVAAERGAQTREDLIAQALEDTDEQDGVQVVASDDKAGVLESVKRSYRNVKGAKKSSGFGIGTQFRYKGKNGTTLHTVVGEGKTKHGRNAWICRNANGKDKAWNKKSVALYIERGTIQGV